MFFVEGSVFFLFLGGYCAWLLLSERILRWRDQREARKVSSLVDTLPGKPILDILHNFGPPREQFTGSTGRSLYVWQRPPSNALPKTRDPLVITLTVDPEGRVIQADWQRK